MLTTKLPSLKILSEYLDSLVNILLKLNIPVIWITPSGLKINLSTMKFKKVRTASKLFPNSKPVSISLPTSTLDKNKIKRSTVLNNYIKNFKLFNKSILKF